MCDMVSQSTRILFCGINRDGRSFGVTVAKGKRTKDNGNEERKRSDLVP